MTTKESSHRRSFVRHDDVAADLRNRIVAGEFKPGMQIPTLTQLAEEYLASRMTVQRAVEDLRYSRHVVSIHRAGSFVSDAPPHLARFGLVFSMNTEQSHYLVAWRKEAQRFNAIHSSPDSDNHSVAFFQSVDNPSTISNHYELVKEVVNHSLAGLIFPFPPVGFHGTPVLDHPQQPRVMFTSHQTQMEGVVSIHNPPQHKKVFEMLKQAQCRRIAFICSSRQAAPGYVKTLIEAATAEGMITRPYWIHGCDVGSPEWANTCAQMLVRVPPDDRPDAIVIMDDNLVPYATAGLAESGVDIPREVKVFAATNFPHPTQSAVPAVRFGLNIREMLELSVNIIQRSRNKEEFAAAFNTRVYSEDEIDL